MIRRTHKLNRNKGFTLVELIVVLVLLTILISLGVSGLLSWQDYSQFKQENTNAETIFYAVQNQFTEYSSSGVFEEKVTAVIEQNIDRHVIGSPSNHSAYFDGNTIAYGDSEHYSWDEIWINTPTNISGNDSKENYQGRICYVAAKKGDYDKYLSDPESVDPDAKLLFDIISSYISDNGVLNGAICVEFSPEARQVFSVCYSDRAREFTYDENDSGSVRSILDRRETVRQEKMIGYYAADSLSVAIVGRSKGKASSIEIRNGSILDLIVTPIETNLTGKEYIIKLFSAVNGGFDPDSNPLASFSVEVDKIQNITSLQQAVNTPQDIKFSYENGTEKTFRVPVWKEETDGFKIHILLDAADVQAQSYLYDGLLKNLANNAECADEAARFSKTYSFYRFGFDMDTISEIGATVQADGVDTYGQTEETTSPVFSAVHRDSASDQSADTYVITNGRHLYNVRFETDYKGNKSIDHREKQRIFKLGADIDWNEFVGKGASGATNYYLNSYEQGKNVGIDYDGNDYSINRKSGEILGENTNPRDTSDYAFPGFMALGKNDTFTGVKEDGEEGDYYTISNLTITYAANMAYGVYGKDAKDIWNHSGADYSLADFGSYSANETGAEKHPAHVNANKGLYPLGLFAENDGTIENLSLNAHRVIGMELLKYDVEHTSNTVLVYTNMVGGFAGDNLGRMRNLKLRCVSNDDLSVDDTRANEAVGDDGLPVTYVNGKTDVGGILGRVSWNLYSADDLSAEKNPLDNLQNYGRVTGMENVGGIVGRAYIIRTYKQENEKFSVRYHNYVDGYDIYGGFQLKTDGTVKGDFIQGKSITQTTPNRVTKIVISNCISRGEVRGDDLIYSGHLVKVFENRYTHYKVNGIYIINNVDFSNHMLRCANIGGIAGIAMDGHVTDNNSNNWFSSNPDIPATEDKMSMIIENCNAYRLYSADELSVLKSAGSIPDSEIKNMLEHDYYKGGLIGYSKLALIRYTDNEIAENKIADTDQDSVDNGYKAFVFGRNYIGGIFGCYDLSIISRTDKVDDKYNSVNKNNVVGVMFVGGISGGFGIGDESQRYFSFRHPSCNEGSVVSQTSGKAPVVDGMLNTGLVLGVKRKALDYDGIIKNQDYDIAYNISNIQTTDSSGEWDYQGLGVQKDFASPSAPDSNVGGIVGVTRLPLKNVDNIQSTATKKYILELLCIDAQWPEDDNAEAIDAFRNTVWSELEDVWTDSIFGGNSIGGIVGKMCAMDGGARIEGSSIVDALVYGSDSVGGIIGSMTTGVVVSNATTDLGDTIIIGRDMVGGVVGNLITSFNTSATFNNEYAVFGRYAVGGAFGASNTSAGIDYTIASVYVRGKTYVGGYAGMVTSNNTATIKGNINNGVVKADYFAGGTVGAIYTSQNNDTNYKLSNISTKSSKTYTEAKAFSGGFVGLYAHHKEPQNNQNLMVEWNDDYNYDVIFGDKIEELQNRHNVFKNLYKQLKAENKSHNLEILAENLATCTSTAAVLDKIAYSETNGVLKYGSTPVNTSLSFGGNALTALKVSDQASRSSITADVFAGGIFGYIPNGQNVEINVNNNNIKANVTSRSSISASELASYATNNDYFECYSEATKLVATGDGSRKLSYAGGIIGRIPETVKITKAVYSGAINAGTGDSKSFYLGQIAEVNAGTINESKVSAFDANSSVNEIAGGLTGLNIGGITIATTNPFTKDIDLKGQKILGGLIGENRADMDLADWNLNDSVSGYVVKSISITGGYDNSPQDSAIGLIAGVNYGNVDIKNSVVSAIKINRNADLKAESVGAYFGINYGTVTSSANGANTIKLFAEGSADNHSVYAGLIVGRNHGSIGYKPESGSQEPASGITVSDTSELLTSYSGNKPSNFAYYDYAGAICGLNSGVDDSHPATVSNCTNLSVIGNQKYNYITNASGIVGLIDGPSNIDGCKNSGTIHGIEVAAGIVACISEDASGNVTINNCVNTGDITATSESGDAHSAGIVAAPNGKGNIILCRNYGIINGVGTSDYGIAGGSAESVQKCLEASARKTSGVVNTVFPYDSETATNDYTQNYYVAGSVPDGSALDSTEAFAGWNDKTPLPLYEYWDGSTGDSTLTYSAVDGENTIYKTAGITWSNGSLFDALSGDDRCSRVDDAFTGFINQLNP